uniref:Protein-export membrane protein SecG n=1 Tax=Eiseniibacteriota bacterium TaxID=2212470 RepID=A0A832MK50_UNCEI
MFIALLILHLIICLALVAVVLVQSGKGGGLAGGAFGGSAQTVFGGKGAVDFVTRATMVLGGLFFVTSLSLALLTSSTGRGTRSLIQEEAQRARQTAPGQLPQAPGGVPAPAGGTAPSGGAAPAPAGGAPAPAPAPAGGGR